MYPLLALSLGAAFIVNTCTAQTPLKAHCGELGTLKVGDAAPTFHTDDIHGIPVDLARITAEKQVVLVFYRGA